ncbi:MAG: translation initiation inhibitor [Bacteroidales bacterium]|nr:translation initiation inhibitor [Bacteroidales bacterium]
MKRFEIIRPASGEAFSDALASLFDRIDRFFCKEAAEGRHPVFVRFFLSDAQNQISALRSALEAWSRAEAPAVSIVEQPPLDGSRIAALVQTASEKKTNLFHSLRLTEEEAAGKDSYAQSRLLLGKYLDLIRPLGLALKTHCVRTWIYVRDIDANYAGLVKARNDVFAEEGLSHDTHYIASTGIGGATEGRNAVVAIDFLTRPDIRESDKIYLKALSHLSPTHDYGVAFERGVRLSDGQIFISGTASIDSRGQVLHEGDVVAQADRLLENVSVLLQEGGSSLDRVPYFVIYLRDISDYPVIDAYMQERFPAVPRILLEARVCRPSWLIEMECEVAQ